MSVKVCRREHTCASFERGRKRPPLHRGGPGVWWLIETVALARDGCPLAVVGVSNGELVAVVELSLRGDHHHGNLGGFIWCRRHSAVELLPGVAEG